MLQCAKWIEALRQDCESPIGSSTEVAPVFIENPNSLHRRENAMSLRLLLTISGGLEVLMGVLALLSPATVVSLLLGSPMDQLSAVVTRLFGAAVFALGLACLKARDDVESAAGLAVSLGITSYNILAAVVITWAAAGLGLGGLLLWLAGIGHAVLGALFVSALVTSSR
jgi:hypothetical protein